MSGEQQLWAEVGVDYPGFALGDEVQRQDDDGTITLTTDYPQRIFDRVLGAYYEISAFTRDAMVDFHLYTATGGPVCHLRVMNMNQQDHRFDLGYLLLRAIFITDPQIQDARAQRVRAKLDLRRFGRAVQASYAASQPSVRLYFDQRRGNVT